VKTSTEEVGKNKVKLTVEVPTEDVEKVLGRTYKRLAQEVRVPGFRPGKAPRSIIDQRLGRDYVRNEALRESLPDFYAEAVRESDLDVVAPPSIDIKTFEDGADLTFEATVETRPTPELKNYSGLPGEKPKVDVKDADVDEQIEHLRTRFATLEPTERPLQNGDFATIDLTTYRHDVTIDELTAKDLLVEVGAEVVVPELDKELEGKRKGDILKVTATLSERFAERDGWQVGMQVLVKDTKMRKLPALDDELAKTVSEFDTLQELRDDLHKRLVEAQEGQATNRLRESVLEAFVEQAVEVDLPEGMIELEIDGLVRGLAQLLAAQGMPIDRYMEAQNLDTDALRARFHEQAERNIKTRLGLDAVVASEGLEVTDEEREHEIEHMAVRTGRSPDEIKELIDEREDWESVDGDILRSKALDLLVERADVKETEPSADALTEGDANA
jgi:trigger factor